MGAELADVQSRSGASKPAGLRWARWSSRFHREMASWCHFFVSWTRMRFAGSRRWFWWVAIARALSSAALVFQLMAGRTRGGVFFYFVCRSLQSRFSGQTPSPLSTVRPWRLSHTPAPCPETRDAPDIRQQTTQWAGNLSAYPSATVLLCLASDLGMWETYDGLGGLSRWSVVSVTLSLVPCLPVCL